MSGDTNDTTFHFLPTGDKPRAPYVMASARCGRDTMVVRWVEVIDHERHEEQCPEHGLEVVWVPIHGRTFAESEPMPRTAWRTPEKLRDFATRILGPEPEL